MNLALENWGPAHTFSSNNFHTTNPVFTYIVRSYCEIITESSANARLGACLMPPAHNASWRVGAPGVGYCALTIARGDCWLGDSGTLHENVSSLQSCKRECKHACPRCAFVSWSARNQDCSWYAQCDLRDLRRPPKGAPDYVSVQVRRTLPDP